MQSVTLSSALRLERLQSRDELRQAMCAILGPGDGSGREGDAVAPGGIAVCHDQGEGGRSIVVLGLRHESEPAGFGLGRFRAVSVSPFLVALPEEGAPGGDEVVSGAVRAALRELFVGEGDWHVLRLSGLPDAAVDAAWRSGTMLGFSCAISREPPPARTPEGVVVPSRLLLTFYSRRLKGRLAHAADTGFLGMLRGAASERASALVGRFGGRHGGQDDVGGSRFFTLELASMPAAPSWGGDVTFREVPEAEATGDPLRFSTSVRRMDEALRRGDRCFATLVGGVLAHHHWVSRDPEFLGRMLPVAALDRPTAHPFDSYTWPAFRGRGLQGATHHWLALQYRSEGVERFAVRVSSFNSASMRGIQKVGYVEI